MNEGLLAMLNPEKIKSDERTQSSKGRKNKNSRNNFEG